MPSTELEPIVATPTEKPKPDFKLQIVSDVPMAEPGLFMAPGRMHRWAVERLRRSSLLDTVDGGQANRKVASDRAKASKEAFIVLFDLQSDPFVSAGSRARRATLYVTIFSPETGKIKATRGLAMGMNSTRLPGSRSVLQACYPDAYRDDLLLLEATVEAADFVMDHFRVPRPPLCQTGGPF